MWRPPDKAMSSTAARFYEVMAASVAGDGRQIQRRAPMWGQPFYSSHPVVCHTLDGAPDATTSPPLRYAPRAPLRGGEPVIPGPQQAQTKLHGRFAPLTVNNRMGSIAQQRSARPSTRSTPRRVRHVEARRESRGPMPEAAREALERALCGVLERRYPGQRFAMKDQLDSLGDRPVAPPAAAGDTDGLKDAA
jgi:hypothetical protein